ncbi:uncharacterized protein isoform X6 [Macaca fascicularis]|uniref:uncharacterized protein isoform X6 n=1 Tax=Macaca fascicularis TaxID=9541 RepID=UPI003D159A9F
MIAISERRSRQDSTDGHLRCLWAARLYGGDQLVIFLQSVIKPEEPAKAVAALQAFRDVSCRVPQMETLKKEVMSSVVLLIQKNPRPARWPSRKSSGLQLPKRSMQKAVISAFPTEVPGSSHWDWLDSGCCQQRVS